MVCQDVLFQQYFNHVRHTERERNQYLQILLGVSGGGILLADNYVSGHHWVRLLFYCLMCIVSCFSYLIMKKKRHTIKKYSCLVFKYMEKDDSKEVSKISISEQYENIMLLLIVTYFVLGSGTLIFQIVVNTNQIIVKHILGIASIILLHILVKKLTSVD